MDCTVANHIIDGIYIGSIHNARDLESLHRDNIRCIINCSEMDYTLADDSIEIYSFFVTPSPSQTPLKYFHDVFEKIDSYLSKKEHVLIHCYYGQTRSAVVTTAFLIWKNKLSLKECYRILMKGRPICDISYEYYDLLENLVNEWIYGKEIQINNDNYESKLIQFSLNDIKDENELKVLVSSIQVDGIKWGNWNIEETPFNTYNYIIEVFVLSGMCDFNKVFYTIQNTVNSICSDVTVLDE
ncbi:hypothetical protein WA158_005408 [Blastocystis sp. Blastoise]